MPGWLNISLQIMINKNYFLSYLNYKARVKSNFNFAGPTTPYIICFYFIRFISAIYMSQKSKSKLTIPDWIISDSSPFTICVIDEENERVVKSGYI